MDSDGPCELYDLAQDRSETRDLAIAEPDRASRLARAWSERLDEFRALVARD